MITEERDERFEQEIEEAWNRIRLRLKGRAPEGRLLSTSIGDGRIAAGEALRLALEISRTLMSLHAAGRAHPDLRAENVLITHAGEVRILERGFAPTPESLEIGYGRPAEAAVVDLYRSLSPEQVAGKEPDQRSNLFSLGVLLYELLTGVSPFRAETPLETASRILSLDPLPANELNSAIARGLSDLLGRLLAKEPEDRPSGVAMVVNAIESAIDPRHPCRNLPQSKCSSLEDAIEHLYDEIIAVVQGQASDDRSRVGRDRAFLCQAAGAPGGRGPRVPHAV